MLTQIPQLASLMVEAILDKPAVVIDRACEAVVVGPLIDSLLTTTNSLESVRRLLSLPG